VCVCGDDVNRCDWFIEGMTLLVSRRRDGIGGACSEFGSAGPKKGRSYSYTACLVLPPWGLVECVADNGDKKPETEKRVGKSLGGPKGL